MRTVVVFCLVVRNMNYNQNVDYTITSVQFIVGIIIYTFIVESKLNVIVKFTEIVKSNLET